MWLKSVLAFLGEHPGLTLVFVGVFLEIFEILFRLKCKHRSQRCERWLEAYAIVCWIVLTLGLAFEFKETKSMDRQIHNAEPLNQPISPLTAKLSLSFGMPLKDKQSPDTFLPISPNSIAGLSGQLILNAEHKRFTLESKAIQLKSPEPGSAHGSFSMNFEAGPFDDHVEILNALHSILLVSFSRIPEGTMIESGMLIITANNTSKKFTVPRSIFESVMGFRSTNALLVVMPK